jgi:hypothetical protein
VLVLIVVISSSNACVAHLVSTYASKSFLTTNLAESWMHIRTKFDGGNVYNLCNRGSWHAHCYGGALRMNLGPEWSCKVWEDLTGTEPGYHFRKLYSRRDQTLKSSLKHKSKPNVQHMRWKKK